jgi:hypothetical protein
MGNPDFKFHPLAIVAYVGRAGSRAAKIGVLDEKKFLRLTRDGLRESALGTALDLIAGAS